MDMKSREEGVQIIFESISFKAGKQEGEKPILQNVSGLFPAGKLVGVLGPSGAGKTTLLDTLCGFKKCCEGKVTSGSRQNFSYVPHENNLHGLLTLFENMKFATDIKLGSTQTNAYKAELVEDLLKKFGLWNVRDVQTSDLSGGEAKRLSICLELIDDPAVVYLDEPTTQVPKGLDSLASKQCLKSLKTLCNQGITVVCSLHQLGVEELQMLDVVYILSDGKCMYCGEAGALLAHLESLDMPCKIYHNPADYVIEIATGEYGGDKVDKLVTSCNNGKVYVKSSKCDFTKLSVICTSFSERHSKKDFDIRTLAVLLRREYIKIRRDMFGTHMKILTTIAVSFAVGALYWNIGRKPSKIYFTYLMIMCNYTAVMLACFLHSLVILPLENAVIKREYLNRYYSVGTYLLQQIISSTPLTVFCSLFPSTVVYYCAGFPMELKRILMFLSINVCNGLVLQTLGLGVSSHFMDVQKSLVIGVMIKIPNLTLGGFGIMFADMPKYFQWLSYLMSSGYALGGSLKAFYGYRRPTFECEVDYCLFSSGQGFLSHIGLGEEDIWCDYLMLFLFYLLFLGVAYVGLLRNFKKR